ncbi:hypothetical protein KMP13_06320 [Epibacterium ulvae]|uniref:hypothetical protein n=1 Tax=Epibacterium ulvae TaxID=1156985 RepID=UPI001BFC4FDD|nr:hypothetical protein [Epibacterium ulvae]MBT8153516.1 hypothetical protein [Epibacterium ulvae]
MKPIFRPQPHRKFIALILGLSLVVSGFSAAPARADGDVAKFIAGAVVLGLIGAAVNDARKDRNRGQYSYSQGSRSNTHTRHDKHNNRVRPLPSSVARYDLPAHCAKVVSQNNRNRTVVSQRCLSRNYGYVNSLPGQCRLSIRDGYKQRTAYRTRCLQKHGYRLVNR